MLRAAEQLPGLAVSAAWLLSPRGSPRSVSITPASRVSINCRPETRTSSILNIDFFSCNCSLKSIANSYKCSCLAMTTQSSDDLKYGGGYMSIKCKYRALLYKELAHLWSSVFKRLVVGGPIFFDTKE